VSRTLDVIANSSCACTPFSPPPTTATRCRDQAVTFSGTASSETQCIVSVAGETPDLGSRTGSLQIYKADGQCMLAFSVSWNLDPCGGTGLYYAWTYAGRFGSYSVTFYRFLYVNGSGGTNYLDSSASTVPTAPSGYYYGGAMWTVTISVSLA
jgi:hypothetical protein